MEKQELEQEFYKNEIAHPMSSDKLRKKILKNTKSL
jgi:hypothetical protein